MNKDWFRRKTWTKKDKKDFFERLERSRDPFHKSQYLRIQASYIYKKYPSEALFLLQKLEKEFPEESQLASAYLQMAECFIKLEKYDNAIKYFRLSIEYEKEQPSFQTRAFIDFPVFIVSHGMVDFYSEIREILLNSKEKLLFPVDRYYYYASLSIIFEYEKNKEKAKTFAIKAINTSSEKCSGFKYHQNIGLVKEDRKINSILNRIIRS